MRWLFLFVLLVNIIFVGWQLSQSTDEELTQKTSENIPAIELLSEIGRDTKIPTEETAAVSKASQSRQSATTPAKPEKRQAPKTSIVTKPGAARCYTLGPFRELDNLRAFTRAIKDYVSTASFRSREEQEQSMFWVYLEPSVSLNKARMLGKRLEDKKIKDYYVISSGPKVRGISLGHFRDKGRAQAHSQRIEKLGFKPVLEPVFRSFTIYWLDYQVPGDKLIPKKTFSKYLTKKINRLDRSCS